MPQSLDSWPGIAVALLAAVAAFLVPFTGFVKTILDYRHEERRAEDLKPEVARDLAQSHGAALFDSMAMADLTTAVKDLTAAIRADTASDEAQRDDALGAAILRLTEHLDHRDKAESAGRRPGHR